MISIDHFSIKSSNYVAAICTELIQRFRVHHFIYIRYYKNGSCCILSNHPNLIYHHLTHGYHIPAPVPKKLLAQTEAFHLVPSHGPFQQARHDILNIFQSDCCFDLIYKLNDGYEIFSYAFGINDHNAVNTFLNNINSFKKFSLYFKEKAAGLIQIAKKHPIFLPKEMRGIKMHNVKPLSQFNSHQEWGEMKKFRFHIGVGEIALTKREIDCIRYFMKGYTYKEIGNILDLSHRTIETYLENAQSKLHCQNKSQMLELLLEIYPLIK